MTTTPLDIASTAVVKAGEKLKKHFGNISIDRNKGDRFVDVVTKLDIETENFLASEFQKFDPSIGFYGEEFGVRSKGNKYWLVDPIDGTAHFVRGIPFCTTMVALVENDIVTTSVIYNFVTGELFTAQKGLGATLNGKEIKVSSRSLKDAYMSVETNIHKDENLKIYRKINEDCIVMNTVNCGYEFGLVARGKLDGRISFDPYGKDWDYAAGSLLVEEAGGIVKNVGKDSYIYSNHDFLAVNPQVYADLTSGDSALFPIK